MTDTVNTPVEGTNTGNDAANAAPAANETVPAGQPADTAAAQPHGEQEKTSATPAENTPKEGDGKVTEADKDNTSDKGAVNFITITYIKENFPFRCDVIL